jgi:hypothetical protein
MERERERERGREEGIKITVPTNYDAIFDFECSGSEENLSRNSKKCFVKARLGESDVAHNLEEVNESIAAISNLCRGKELSCDTKDFVRSDDPLATHYSFELATDLLAVRITQNEDVEDEEEEGEEAAREQDI